MRINQGESEFVETRVEDLKSGDQVLVKHYGVNGEWVEHLLEVDEVRERRYGSGSRYIVTWVGFDSSDSYPAGCRFGVAR